MSRTTGLNRRRWLAACAVFVAASAAGGCGGQPLAVPTSPTPLPGSVFDSQTFGIRVRLPAGWRRATHPELAYARPDGTGREVFTVRSAEDDAKLVALGGHAGAFPWLSHTVTLHVLENPRRLSTIGYVAQTAPNANVNFHVSGRPAVRIDESLGFGVSSIYVARDDQILWFRPYPFRSADWLPKGWTEHRLRQEMQALIDSLELTR